MASLSFHVCESADREEFRWRLLFEGINQELGFPPVQSLRFQEFALCLVPFRQLVGEAVDEISQALRKLR